MAVVGSVNVGRVRRHPPGVGLSAIDKQPSTVPVEVRAPGPVKGFSGLATDEIASSTHHGGDEQAVYAYAREDLDAWQARLGRPLASGGFGENLTTVDLDVTGALIGERWRIGADLVLQVTKPRIPCGSFAAWMAETGWVKTFVGAAVPGAYLRVLHPGPVAAGDPVVVTGRPDHDVTVGVLFRAMTLEPDLLPRVLAAEDVPAKLREKARRRLLTSA